MSSPPLKSPRIEPLCPPEWLFSDYNKNLIYSGPTPPLLHPPSIRRTPNVVQALFSPPQRDSTNKLLSSSSFSIEQPITQDSISPSDTTTRSLIQDEHFLSDSTSHYATPSSFEHTTQQLTADDTLQPSHVDLSLSFFENSQYVTFTPEFQLGPHQVNFTINQTMRLFFSEPSRVTVPLLATILEPAFHEKALEANKLSIPGSTFRIQGKTIKTKNPKPTMTDTQLQGWLQSFSTLELRNSSQFVLKFVAQKSAVDYTNYKNSLEQQQRVQVDWEDVRTHFSARYSASDESWIEYARCISNGTADYERLPPHLEHHFHRRREEILPI
ncbi:hypothetical protein RCL1_007187 [Eukaryota sp. TZLM3-RCL]